MHMRMHGVSLCHVYIPSGGLRSESSESSESSALLEVRRRLEAKSSSAPTSRVTKPSTALRVASCPVGESRRGPVSSLPVLPFACSLT